jgi:hypothetical protein
VKKETVEAKNAWKMTLEGSKWLCEHPRMGRFYLKTEDTARCFTQAVGDVEGRLVRYKVQFMARLDWSKND